MNLTRKKYGSIVQSSQGALAAIQKVTRILTPAEILAGNSNPPEIIPAPGAGRVIIPNRFAQTMDFNSIAYATNTEFFFRLGGIQISPSGANINDPVDVAWTIQPLNIKCPVNSALNWFINGGNPTGGNSPIKVIVYYEILDL